MRVTIKGRRWTILRKPKVEHTLGLTEYNHTTGIRRITFFGQPSMSTIKHEVMHAFLSTRNFQGSSYGQIEEQVCDEVGNNLERILRVSKQIRSGLRYSSKTK